MRLRIVALFCIVAGHAAAQFGLGLGAGIPSLGSNVGTRAGQDVSLRFYADATGIYDTGIVPYTVDSKGNLVSLNGLFGEEVVLGAYGVHEWEHAQLGLDYRGNFRHYDNAGYLDGMDQQLALAYSQQLSKRLFVETMGMGGTFAAGGAIEGVNLPSAGFINQPGTNLYDNRVTYGEGGMNLTYMLTRRTSFIVGGEGFLARHEAAGLVGVNGYLLRGVLQHQLSRHTTAGAFYQHLHFDYPGIYGQSDINVYEGFVNHQISRRWDFRLQAGVFNAEVQGVQQVAVNPVITQLLGVTSTTQTFYTSRLLPAGQATLQRAFRRASLAFNYGRYVSPGNGVYLASRTEMATASFSYLGLRKLSLNFSSGGVIYHSVGQDLGAYRQLTAGTGLSYRMNNTLQFTARYDSRYQEVFPSVLNRLSYRVALGVAFSPQPVPISFR